MAPEQVSKSQRCFHAGVQSLAKIMDLLRYPDIQFEALWPKGEDVLVVCATLFALTYSYWIPLVRKDREIPNDFWYRIPQATGAHAESRQKKAEERRINHIFKERVWLSKRPLFYKQSMF
jgi:hypothetical protein